MPLNWPSISTGADDMPLGMRARVTKMLNEVGDRLLQIIESTGGSQFDFDIFRPWNLLVLVDSRATHAVFGALHGGMADMRWMHQPDQTLSQAEVETAVTTQLGWRIVVSIELPLPEDTNVDHIMKAVTEIMQDTNAKRLRSAVDLEGAAHLEPFAEEFLTDHPDVTRNVFLMMRFRDTDHHKVIETAVRDSVDGLGMTVIRADDRDYTGDLWMNVELCMRCCRLGVAVFESIDESDFNPNISLELGYMLALKRRVLLLKEKRLASLPADVVHKLYKPFDMFNIGPTVSAQVSHWVQNDLRLT